VTQAAVGLNVFDRLMLPLTRRCNSPSTRKSALIMSWIRAISASLRSLTLGSWLDFGLSDNIFGAFRADTEDIGQGHPELLLVGIVTPEILAALSLPLLMLRFELVDNVKAAPCGGRLYHLD